MATIAQFNPEQETCNEFLERFTVQNSDLIEKAGTDGKKKAVVLVKALPVPVITDLQRRIKPMKLSDATYDELEGKLKAQFETKKSIVGASVQFLNRKQHADESIENYARVLNDLANCCRYKDCCLDRLLRDSFISGLRSTKILGGLLQDCENDEKKSFNDCVAKAKLLEQISQDAQDIRPGDKAYAIKTKPQENSQSFKASKPPKKYVCIRCGSKGQHLARNCYALNKTCANCQKTGHLTKVCKSAKSTEAKFVAEARSTHQNRNAAAYLGSAAPTTNQRAGFTAANSNHLHQRACPNVPAACTQPCRCANSPAGYNPPQEDELYNFLE